MTAAEILLKIKALFERKGVDEAKEAVDSLGNAGKEAGASASQGMSDAADAAKEAGEAASEGMGKVADAAGNAGDALKQAGDAAGQMGTQTASAAVFSAGNISKVTAAVTALYGIFKMVNDAIIEGQHSLAELQLDNIESGVEGNRAAVERLARAYETASKMRSLLSSAQSAGIDMARQEQLAFLELEKARELASAKDDDDRRRIELRYAAQAREVNYARDEEAYQAERNALADEYEANGQQLDDLRKHLAELNETFAEVTASAMDKNQIAGILGTGKDAEKWRAEAERLFAVAKGYEGQIKETSGTIADLEQRQEELKIASDRNSSARFASLLRNQAAQTTESTASRDLEKAIADRKAEEERRREAEERAARRKAEADRLNAGIEANNERGEELQGKYQEVRETYAPKLAAARERAQVERQSAANAARAFGAFRREGTDSTVGGYDKVVASANQRAQSAASELASMERELAATLDAITAELRRLKEDSKNKAKQIRSLPN